MKKGTKTLIWIVVILIVLFGAWKLMAKPSYDNVETLKPFRGDADAQVTLTEFSDLQCPACRAAHPTVKQILADYDNQVKVEYKHFPLTSIHPYAFRAAMASECANDQGEFWLYVDKVFANQNNMKDKALVKYAEDLGLDSKKFKNCLLSEAKSSTIKFEMAEGREMKLAFNLAQKNKLKVALIDQDIQITLKRLTSSITWGERFRFVWDIVKQIIKRKPEIEFDLTKVPSQKVIDQMVSKVKNRYPNVYRTLIVERNEYMSRKLAALMAANEDKKILAVVGAGHEREMIDIIKKEIKKYV